MARSDLTSQLAQLTEAERWQLLVRLAHVQPRLCQALINDQRKRPARRDIEVIGFGQVEHEPAA